MANKTKHLKDPSGNIEWINGKYPIPTAKGFRKDNQTPQPENHLDNDKDINSIDERIKTQFGLALASEPTEDGKRAIERFYYGFLNNYPGYDYLADQYTQSKLKAFAGDFEALLKNQPMPKRGDVVPDIYVEVLHRIEGANATRGEIRQALKAIKERWNV